MLNRDDTTLVLVDVQGKLAQSMCDREALFDALQRVVRGARALALPVSWLEQNPRGLGPTLPALAALLPDLAPIPKLCFSACRCPEFMRALRATGRHQVLLCGIEAHVCITQTALDLLALGYAVHVVADAVSSRTASNRQLGLERVRAAGATLTSAEMCLFELQREAVGPAFRELLQIVR